MDYIKVNQAENNIFQSAAMVVNHCQKKKNFGKFKYSNFKNSKVGKKCVPSLLLNQGHGINNPDKSWWVGLNLQKFSNVFFVSLIGILHPNQASPVLTELVRTRRLTCINLL